MRVSNWNMRATKQDKKVIAKVAKHFRCTQTQLIKKLVYAADTLIQQKAGVRA